MAASSPELDAASRARVIAHMNADHAADVSLILQFYAGQSPPEAAQARMTDIDMVNMTIESASGTHVVRIIPTMAKWADCRASLVSMSRSAHAALDPVPFAPPEGWDIVVTAGVVLYFVCYALVQAGLVDGPDMPIWRFLEAIHFPFGPVLFRRLVIFIFIPVLGIHFLEMGHFHRNRLAMRGMTGSLDWVLWLASIFFGGLPALFRFDRVVEERMIQATKAKKH